MTAQATTEPTAEFALRFLDLRWRPVMGAPVLSDNNPFTHSFGRALKERLGCEHRTAFTHYPQGMPLTMSSRPRSTFLLCGRFLEQIRLSGTGVQVSQCGVVGEDDDLASFNVVLARFQRPCYRVHLSVCGGPASLNRIEFLGAEVQKSFGLCWTKAHPIPIPDASLKRANGREGFVEDKHCLGDSIFETAVLALLFRAYLEFPSLE